MVGGGVGGEKLGVLLQLLPVFVQDPSESETDSCCFCNLMKWPFDVPAICVHHSHEQKYGENIKFIITLYFLKLKKQIKRNKRNRLCFI